MAGQDLKALRIRKGLSALTVAREAGLNVQTYTALEAGELTATLELADEIENVIIRTSRRPIPAGVRSWWRNNIWPWGFIMAVMLAASGAEVLVMHLVGMR